MSKDVIEDMLRARYFRERTRGRILYRHHTGYHWGGYGSRKHLPAYKHWRTA